MDYSGMWDIHASGVIQEADLWLHVGATQSRRRNLHSERLYVCTGVFVLLAADFPL